MRLIVAAATVVVGIAVLFLISMAFGYLHYWMLEVLP
jgi:hypothetical protein